MMKISIPTRGRTAAVVGLDIGSSAVRAAEVRRNGRGSTLRHFGQVELPPGAVVEGEIIDAGAVVTALRRLWSEADFSTRQVVVALSGQRVIVRQAEVAAMSEVDFRSALRYQADELIPIPVDDALLDFVILPAILDEAGRPGWMQVLVAATPRDLVQSHLDVLRQASLHAVAVDPAPMAAVRAAGDTAGSGAVALVDIGADLTVISLRQAGQVRFSRILKSGANDQTTRRGGPPTTGYAHAEGLPREAGLSGPPGTLLAGEVDPLAAQIEGSLSFFAGQLGGTALSSVLISGAPARAPGLVVALGRRLAAPIELFDPLPGLADGGSSLDPDTRALASAGGLLAMGASLWAFEEPSRRLSLLPREAAAAAATRRRWVAVVAGVAVMAAGLAALSVAHSRPIAAAQAQATAARAANARTQSQITALQSVGPVSTAARLRLATLAGDTTGNVAWAQLLALISAAMPAGTQLSGLTFAGPTGGTGSGGGPLGSITMQVTGTGGLEQVAAWLRAFSAVPAISAMSVASATVAEGQVSFSATANVTAAAPRVTRTAALDVQP
jgi:type IV pilus assembly protein PilM